MCWRSSVSISC
jgi:hypothetical protein